MAELTKANLLKLQKRVEKYAIEFGLDFPEIVYEVLDWDTMSQIAALGGFPARYPHWSFGMDYNRYSRSYNYGLHRIYEMVLNTDPCLAYLLASNQTVDQKLVMAHVCGHAHFFKNNIWFAHTNRDMLREMANHAIRVNRYADRYGFENVEKFLDCCLCLDNLIDIHSIAIRRKDEPEHDHDPDARKEPSLSRYPAKTYMDRFINPPEILEAERARKVMERNSKKGQFPAQPERDVLLFLLENAPLSAWQQDILAIIREEAYYFVPQAQTKIINEGFASYCHSKLMCQFVMTSDELIDYCDHFSSGVAMHSSINPYRLGLFLLRDVEERWNRGMFGPDWEDCTDMRARKEWDKKLGLGKEKVFEVVSLYNDIGFLDEFLTMDFLNDEYFFTFDYHKRDETYRISSREFPIVKQRILRGLTNMGRPIIEVLDANWGNRGELYLIHRDEGVDLDVEYAVETLRYLYRLWKRPVHIETIVTKYDARGHEDKRERTLFSHNAGSDSKHILG